MRLGPQHRTGQDYKMFVAGRASRPPVNFLGSGYGTTSPALGHVLADSGSNKPCHSTARCAYHLEGFLWELWQRGAQCSGRGSPIDVELRRLAHCKVHDAEVAVPAEHLPER